MIFLLVSHLDKSDSTQWWQDLIWHGQGLKNWMYQSPEKILVQSFVAIRLVLKLQILVQILIVIEKVLSSHGSLVEWMKLWHLRFIHYTPKCLTPIWYLQPWVKAWEPKLIHWQICWVLFGKSLDFITGSLKLIQLFVWAGVCNLNVLSPSMCIRDYLGISL